MFMDSTYISLQGKYNYTNFFTGISFYEWMFAQVLRDPENCCGLEETQIRQICRDVSEWPLIYLSSSLLDPHLSIFFLARSSSIYLLPCSILIYLSSSLLNPHLSIFFLARSLPVSLFLHCNSTWGLATDTFTFIMKSTKVQTLGEEARRESDTG